MTTNYSVGHSCLAVGVGGAFARKWIFMYLGKFGSWGWVGRQGVTDSIVQKHNSLYWMTRMNLSQYKSFLSLQFPKWGQSLKVFVQSPLPVYEWNMKGGWAEFARWVDKIAEWVTNSLLFLPRSKLASYSSLNNLSVKYPSVGQWSITSSHSHAPDNSFSFVQVVNIGVSCIPLSELNT